MSSSPSKTCFFPTPRLLYSSRKYNCDTHHCCCFKYHTTDIIGSQSTTRPFQDKHVGQIKIVPTLPQQIVYIARHRPLIGNAQARDIISTSTFRVEQNAGVPLLPWCARLSTNSTHVFTPKDHSTSFLRKATSNNHEAEHFIL